MEHLYNFEIDQIIFLQKNFTGLSFFFNFVNQLTSPTMFYLIFLPILGGYDRVLFGKAFLAGVIAEYVNIVLKYYMAEDRPYWWLPDSQTDAYKKAIENPIQASLISTGDMPVKTVMQNQFTCELSAGFPATELAFLAAVLYVLGHHVMVKLECNKNVKSYVFAAYFVVLFMAVASKMYLGAYFFHQLLIGINLGMFIGSVCSTNEFYIMAFNMKRNDVLIMCVSVFAFNFVMYWLLLVVGLDPQWTVKKAMEHCQKIDFLQPESLPTYALVRSFGLLLAFGNALPIYKRYRLEMNILHSMPMAWGILLAAGILYHFIPRHLGVIPFYLSTLAVYLLFYYTLLTVIPKYCCPKLRVFSDQKNCHQQQQATMACKANQNKCGGGGGLGANICR